MATTSRATPASKKPAATFSIEAAEKEWADTAKPDTFTVDLGGGKVARFQSPLELGWQITASLSDTEPFLFIRTVVFDEDYEDFMRTEFSTHTANALIAAWRDHYGVGNQGN